MITTLDTIKNTSYNITLWVGINITTGSSGLKKYGLNNVIKFSNSSSPNNNCSQFNYKISSTKTTRDGFTSFGYAKKNSRACRH